MLRALTIHLLLAALLCSVSACRSLNRSRVLDATTSTPENLNTQELSLAIKQNRNKVPEFQQIAEVAKRMNLRVWLFGGTAAAYAHYVRSDVLRLKGDTRYPAERFDYDFMSIYRSTQDVDIVVDGTPEDAEKFEQELVKTMDFLQGEKEQWEIRTLRHDRGDKLALLNNKQFLDQHTDSNSVGMVEITESNESIIRDLRDWENMQSPQFLRDVAEAKIHFYYSDKHKETKFYKDGRNPEIIAVIRYFTKIFQFELEPRKEDLSIIRKLIEEWDGVKKNDYLANWLMNKGNGAKLYRHAVNVEYAKKILDEFGLREKIIKYAGDTNTSMSLGWWMNKSPLPTKPLGKNGKTARDLFAGSLDKDGNIVVAHDTREFFIYESIMRDTTGRPNVFESREGYTGEAALHGRGFYVSLGRVGARDTGMTIRFILDPNARLGEDFDYVPSDGYLVIKNRAILKTIYESLDIKLIDVLKGVRAGTLDFGEESGNLGVITRFQRKLKRRSLSEQDKQEINMWFKEWIDSLPEKILPGSLLSPDVKLAQFWIAWPNAKEATPWLINHMIETNKYGYIGYAGDLMRQLSHWVNKQDFSEAMVPQLLKNLRNILNSNGDQNEARIITIQLLEYLRRLKISQTQLETLADLYNNSKFILDLRALGIIREVIEVNRLRVSENVARSLASAASTNQYWLNYEFDLFFKYLSEGYVEKGSETKIIDIYTPLFEKVISAWNDRIGSDFAGVFSKVLTLSNVGLQDYLFDWILQIASKKLTDPAAILRLYHPRTFAKGLTSLNKESFIGRALAILMFKEPKYGEAKTLFTYRGGELLDPTVHYLTLKVLKSTGYRTDVILSYFHFCKSFIENETQYKKSLELIAEVIEIPEVKNNPELIKAAGGVLSVDAVINTMNTRGFLATCSAIKDYLLGYFGM